MPVTTSYPGIYIEEVLSTSHSITPAPTSITAFIGYSHPYKTRTFGQAAQLFSFADYERYFGGFFKNAWLTDHLGQAVSQFFLNGGSNAWVVGLQASYRDTSVTPAVGHGVLTPATVNIGGLVFTAREPTDDTLPMTITINNLQKTVVDNDTADIIVVYGTQVDTMRRVLITDIEAKVGNVAQPRSPLVTVAQGATVTYTAADQTPLAYATAPNANWQTFNPADFGPVFAADESLDKVPIFNLMVLAGITDNTVLSEALAYCERKHAFVIMDPPRDAAADDRTPGLSAMGAIWDSGVIPTSTNGAIYFPYLRSTDPIDGSLSESPPSGFVAGVIAREDTNRGVWKAPAGLEALIRGTPGVVERGRMTDMRHGTLNERGVNCIRQFAGVGSVVFGARTLVSENPAFEQFRYANVRRMALFLEQSLLNSLGWVVFESNDFPLWTSIRTTIDAFMLGLFHQGAFQGETPSQAFKVLCDHTTTTQDDVNQGRVNIVVGFAPLKPAEFVIIKIAQLAGQPEG